MDLASPLATVTPTLDAAVLQALSATGDYIRQPITTSRDSRLGPAFAAASFTLDASLAGWWNLRGKYIMVCVKSVSTGVWKE